MRRTRFVEFGRWRTLESAWGAEARAIFVRPARAQIKVRYGNGPWCGMDSQHQRLDGLRAKELKVGLLTSMLYARMQIAVPRSVEVTYEIDRGFPKLRAV